MFFALGLVGPTDLLAGAVRGARLLLLLQGVFERLHFTGEALYLAAKFLDAGSVGIACSLRATRRVRAGVWDALG